MITCSECIKRFTVWGDDPRVKSGRYRLCGCDYCSKPEYDRQLEQPQPKLEIPDSIEATPIEVKQFKHQVEQAKAGYLHLQNKLNEHLDKSKNKDRI